MLFEDVSIYSWILFAVLMFGGGFMDAIVGGGGLLSLPAYMMMPIPITHAFGSNKFSGCSTSFLSFLQYLRGHDLKLRLLVKLLPFAFLGAFCGARLFLSVSTAFLEAFIPFMIIGVGIYSLIDKNMGRSGQYRKPEKHTMILGSFLIFIMGIYDGFFGPGSGIFFILILTKVFKLDFIAASGGTKLMTVVTGFTAFSIYFYKGNVIIALGLTGLFFSFIGSFIGGHLALTKGTKFIRPVFITVSFLLAANLLRKKFGF